MPQHFIHHRLGEWLPRDHRVLESWIAKRIAMVEHPEYKKKRVLHDVILEFKTLIEADPEIWMGFHQMFEQVPSKPPYNKDPTGKCQIRNYKLMLELFNYIIDHAPYYEDDDLVGFPINAILDWPMGTPGGFTAFVNPKVNAMFKKMFDVWANFLQSEKSSYVLTKDPNGWFGPAASAAMPNFTEMFICDPNAEHYGFKSWDNFFTRQFRDGVRPVDFPDHDTIVNSACESTVYRDVVYHVKEQDLFWLKGESYSLRHIFNNDELTSKFIGGTVYQAFLSALNYHRWHSPVNGTIYKTVNIAGTYYAESPYHGFPSMDGPGGNISNPPDPAGPNASQSFITALAARALVFIQANEPVGLMCFVAVGMAEVSTCEITVKEGQKVKKGDQLGMFHFGGSTHCLIFRPDIKFTPDDGVKKDSPVNLNAAIGSVVPA